MDEVAGERDFSSRVTPFCWQAVVFAYGGQQWRLASVLAVDELPVFAPPQSLDESQVDRGGRCDPLVVAARKAVW